ncbi:MAG: DEAD/DEAH box helicase [Bacteroidales bacterium]|nr:DEAD/DEAH box helicase [Bacteroidales bacterium]
MTFEALGLLPEIEKAIKAMGFVEPTPIQAQAIPHLLGGTQEDLVGFAQTGTGKTAAFGLPIIHQIDVQDLTTQSIILAPTRELCMQIAKDLTNFSKYLDGLKVLAVYGGASIDPQIKSLKQGAQIVVGTPGRTLDLIKRKALKLHKINWLVLDEADEMLNMGFKDDLDSILETTPSERQTMLFSATMPPEVARIARNYMKATKEIRIGQTNSGADNVKHEYYVVKASDKYEALKRIADINPDIYGIVFCRTRKDTQEVAQKLINDGYNADALHGDLSQAQRDNVMQRFRIKNLQMLVATDVAARGLDVNSLSHVINYSLPDDPEVYVHRSGRTGRAGKSGISLTIAHSKELGKIRVLEKMVKKPFEKAEVPGGDAIVQKRLYNLIDNIKKTDVDTEQIDPFMPTIMNKIESLSKEELIQKLVAVEFMRFATYYRGAGDINVKDSGRERDRDRDRDKGKGKRSSTQFSRFYINIGLKSNINVASLIGIINDNTQRRDLEIGRIDLMKRFSFFEIDAQFEKEVLDSFKNAQYKGERIIVEKTDSLPPSEESYGQRRSRGKKKEGGSFSPRSKSSDRSSFASKRGESSRRDDKAKRGDFPKRKENSSFSKDKKKRR